MGLRNCGMRRQMIIIFLRLIRTYIPWTLQVVPQSMVPRLTQEPKRTPSTDDSRSERLLDPSDVQAAFLHDFSIFWIDDTISTLAVYRFDVSVLKMGTISVIVLSGSTQVATSICKVLSLNGGCGGLGERKLAILLLHKLAPIFDNTSLLRRNGPSILFISNTIRPIR